MKPIGIIPSNRLWWLLTLAFAIQRAAASPSATDPTLQVSLTRVLTGVSPTNQGVVLSWNAVNGVPYQIQTTTSLSSWTNLGPTLTGSGSVLSSTNSIFGHSRGFFRVQRVFPAAPGTATFDPATGLLTIVCDALHTNINVANDGTGVVVINSNAGAIPITGGPATTANTALIQILGSPGDDQISLNNGLPPAHVFGAGGNDTLTGGDSSDIIVGGPGADTIHGGRGNDLIYVDGNDTVIWNPGDGSDTIEGTGTNNTLVFNGSNIAEKIELSANGNRVRFTRDIAAVTMDLSGVQTIDINTLGGADNVIVDDLTGTDTTLVNVDLAGVLGTTNGDGAADMVTLAGTAGSDTFNISADGTVLEATGTAVGALVRVLNAEPANDRIVINGVGNDLVNVNGTDGPDTMQVIASGSNALAFASASSAAVQVSGAVTLSINGLGGPDTITAGNGLAATGIQLILDGGEGDDNITGGDGNDIIYGGPGNDTVHGGRGNDMIFLGLGDDIVIWNPGDGSDTIEGQGGNDTLVFNGSNAAENIELSANGSRLRFTRDIAAITLDVNGVKTVNIQALGSADNLTVDNLAGTGVTQVNIDLAGSGGGGDGAADTVTVDGTDSPDTINLTASGGSVVVSGLAAQVQILNPEVADDTVVLNGLGGTDSFNVGPGVTALIGVILNQ
jgi:Ca2+-binding RTX toxin-like protein